MRIWILDDAHFPTGQANDIIPQKYPERARRYVMTHYTDCAGPVASASLDVGMMMTRKVTWIDFTRPVEKPLIDCTELLSVTAVRLAGGDTVAGEFIDLTDRVRDGWLSWDVPAGEWRVCVSFITADMGANNNYINYIDAESVSSLLEAVYDPHYARYADEFGQTIAGFFSDEPGFYNVGGYQMRNAIGRKHMALPWCGELQADYEANRPNWRTELPLLWLDTTEPAREAEQRRHYMDKVSSLYAKNFSRQLGDWCQAHNVEYIGHVIEDFSEHSRLGNGAGHYFRAMEGQAMAGIDNIGGQIIPGNPYGARHGVTDIADGRFYHFALVKLGASSAAIDPKKRGRLMCETFGAYGWNFGVKNMKWVTDLLIAQGVNHLVPHAFSMAEYPDSDCPPHFYARGNNPEYPYFAHLMRYANRLCDLFAGAAAVRPAAVIYPAESDWMNECMKLEAPGQALLESQIDYEVLPTDVFAQKEKYDVRIETGRLLVNGRELRCVIVPRTRYLDEALWAALGQLVAADIPVFFVDALPETLVGECLHRPLTGVDLDGIRRVPLCDLAEAVRACGAADIQVDHPDKNLLCGHFVKEGEHLFMFFNTSLGKEIACTVALPGEWTPVWYDAMENQCIAAELKDGALTVKLAPYESRVLILREPGAEPVPSSAREALPALDPVDISADWAFSKVSALEYPNFPEPEQLAALEPVSARFPGFSGVMRYEKMVELPEGRRAVFAPEHVYEAAEVFVNGRSAGKRVCPPYRWDITALCQAGENRIAVEVVNTPARDALRNPGPFGPERELMEPSGMFGKVIIE